MTSKRALPPIFLLIISVAVLWGMKPQEADDQRISAERLLQNLRTGNFTGKPIDLDLDDADIETLIRTLESRAGMTFELSPNIRLLSGDKRAFRFKGVPWDQILFFALKEASLEAVLVDARILIQPEGGSMMKIVKEDERPPDLKSRGRSLLYAAGLILLVLVVGAGGISWYRTHIRKDRPPRKPLIEPEAANEAIKRIAYQFDVEKIYRREDISVSALADVLSLPPYQLSWVINEKMNTTFSRLVNSYRVEEVKKRLTAEREPDKTILEIAYEAGFATKTSFNRVFKKFTGTTPSQYRERNRA